MRKTPVQQTRVGNIRIADLRLDLAVQRPLYEPKVRQIVAEYDPAALRTLAVSARRNGTFVVLDGQHRLAALKQLGMANGHLVACEIYEGLTLQEEAELFLKLNDGRKPSYREAFDVRLTARDPDALAVKDIIEECGFTVGHKNGAKDGSIAAIAKCEAVYKGFSNNSDRRYPIILKQALFTLKGAWGATSHAVQAPLIEGTGRFYLRYGIENVQVDHLINNLSKYPGGPNRLIEWAKQHAATIGTQQGRAVAEALVLQHNKGLRSISRKLSEWRS